MDMTKWQECLRIASAAPMEEVPQAIAMLIGLVVSGALEQDQRIATLAVIILAVQSLGLDSSVINDTVELTDEPTDEEVEAIQTLVDKTYEAHKKGLN